MDCGAKASKAKGREVKIEVDHLDGFETEKIIDYIFKHLLVDPSRLETVCKGCHAKRTLTRKQFV